MGLFDWVAFEMDCPKCCHPVRGFQSKDGECQLEVVLPWRVQTFWSDCDGCGVQIKFDDGYMIEPVYSTGVEMLPYPTNGKPGCLQ